MYAPDRMVVECSAGRPMILILGLYTSEWSISAHGMSKAKISEMQFLEGLAVRSLKTGVVQQPFGRPEGGSRQLIAIAEPCFGDTMHNHKCWRVWCPQRAGCSLPVTLTAIF